MRSVFGGFAVTSVALALVLYMSHGSDSAPDDVVYLLKGAACGGRYHVSNGDTCDPSPDEDDKPPFNWLCGPQLNLSTEKSGKKTTTSAKCGTGCIGSGNIFGPDCGGGS